jgi:adenylate kinase
MFMGVNGVGKSTLTEMIGAALPDTLTVHASQELRRMFGVATQQELEELSPDEKLSRRTTHLLEIFRRAQMDGHSVLLDTHLLVPIRKDGAVRYENTWADEYTEYVAGAYMLRADPADIRDWRELDAAATGRRRDLSIENIDADQQLNIGEFTALVDRGALPEGSKVIENRAGIIHDIGLRTLNQELAYLR